MRHHDGGDAAGIQLERVADGLPVWLDGNVDTRCLFASGGRRALAEKDARKAIAALVALARVSGKDAIHRTVPFRGRGRRGWGAYVRREWNGNFLIKAALIFRRCLAQRDVRPKGRGLADPAPPKEKRSPHRVEQPQGPQGP